MSVGLLATVALAIAAVASSVVAWLALRSSRKGAGDANAIATEANRIAKRQTDLDVMEATIQTLRENLADAQAETTRLRADLADARVETAKLRSETTTALANVQILSEHIRENLPDLPFPRLRRVIAS